MISQLNFCLYMCKRNSTEANYKVSTSTQDDDDDNNNNNNNNND
jgi:hypothetical protein